MDNHTFFNRFIKELHSKHLIILSTEARLKIESVGPAGKAEQARIGPDPPPSLYAQGHKKTGNKSLEVGAAPL